MPKNGSHAKDFLNRGGVKPLGFNALCKRILINIL
jgi:hypothetical protein